MLKRFTALLRAVAREPMALFAVLGVLLFALASALDLDRKTQIHIDRSEVARLEAYWEAQAQRKPTAAERDTLIAERVEEEILYREALRLGLDREDIIVRRRLAQKLSFLNDDVTADKEPTEDELRAFHGANAARYAEPAFISFEQVYFSPDQRGSRIDASVQALLDDLAQHGGDPPSGAGDPFMLPARNVAAPLDIVARDYGRPFADALRALPQGRWSGPVESAFGVHVVRVSERRGDRAAPFDAVRDRVREDYIAERRRKRHDAWVARLRAQYDVTVDTGEAAR